MCSVFYIDDNTLIKIDHLISEKDESVTSRHWSQDIRPTNVAPVMISGEIGVRLTVQKWGYPNHQNKGVLINARSETVREKRMFQNGIRYRRAAIPAKHFYEWNANKEKNVFYTDSVLYLAGFYDFFDMEERFIILTTAANESMIRVHDRMPLILEEDQVCRWICDDSCTDAILQQKPMQLERQAEYEQMTLF
ncbi:MAG: SOS response-associated peptidase [Clostridiales bacterium]|nr:SOS response-associated peptidase [Clostridiales bacterium]